MLPPRRRVSAVCSRPAAEMSLNAKYIYVYTDLANAKRNWNKTAGYTEAETTAFARILDAPESEGGGGKFVDVWRRLHPDERHYTYFSYRFNCRAKGIGWRLDMCTCLACYCGVRGWLSDAGLRCGERAAGGPGEDV